jgi:oxygen-independent coproporphyrinogen III oxidase
VEAVCAEIKGYRRLYKAGGITLPESFGQAVVDTVYIGGGTPSLLDAQGIQSLLDTIRGSFSAELTEVTLEADPETIEAAKAVALARAGINRVSFGLQSFSDKELIAAGRMHRRADIYRAMPILREAGICNVSFDLIAGLPHQTKESWQKSLEELETLAPEHVSIYLLEIDEESRLGKEVLQGGARYSAGALPSEDEMAEFYEMAQDALRRMGYCHYEISNWAKPGFESKHNLKYWRREPYLGFGAGAHSFSGAERWANARDAAAYVNAVQSGRLPVEQLQKVTMEQALEEELFLGLRQLDGIDVARIEREYGVRLSAKFDPLASAGLVEREGSVVRLAPGRLSISNEVFVELMR